MRLVEHAACRPHHCAILPYVGNSNVRRFFVDTGTELQGFDNHIYLSDVGVEAAAQLIGYPSLSEIGQLKRQLDEALERAETAEAERDELQKKFAAIDVLASADFRARNKPGRPKQTKTGAAA